MQGGGARVGDERSYGNWNRAAAGVWEGLGRLLTDMHCNSERWQGKNVLFIHTGGLLDA